MSEQTFPPEFFSDSTEWMLKKVLFQRLCKQTFWPEVDLFASRNNYQIDKFVSWFPQPGAWHVDAFSFSWQSLKPYIFPPFSLVSRILIKIMEDKVEKALLVVPHWISQSWFPLLLSLMVSLPVRIPRHKDVLTLLHNGQLHPLGRATSLVGVVASGDALKVREFYQMLPTLSDSHGEQELRNNTRWHGGNGVFGY